MLFGVLHIIGVDDNIACCSIGVAAQTRYNHY